VTTEEYKIWAAVTHDRVEGLRVLVKLFGGKLHLGFHDVWVTPNGPVWRQFFSAVGTNLTTFDTFEELETHVKTTLAEKLDVVD
jgi:hypothetical protein